MDKVGIFSPEQARALWQDYQSRQQLQSQLTRNYPQRRPIDEPSPHRVFVLNTTEEAIPPFACLRVIGVEIVGGRTALKVEKPISLDGEFLFNGPYAIEAPADAVPAVDDVDAIPAKFGVGWAYRFGIVVMLGQPPSEPNATYTPIVDSWEIEEGSGPFVVFGDYKITPESETPALIGRFSGGGPPSPEIITGIVSQSLGCNWYVIELGEFIGSPYDGSGSGSGVDCDPCLGVSGAGTAGCTLEISAPASKVLGSGQFVIAYDMFSDKISLIPGTDCLISRPSGLAATASGSGSGVTGTTGEGWAPWPGEWPPFENPVPAGSGSGSGSGIETATGYWQVVNGYREHIVQYKERWDCCLPDGPPTLLGKTPIIMLGHECEEILCGECPGGSGSGSGV
jgi:hypothetical protein